MANEAGDTQPPSDEHSAWARGYFIEIPALSERRAVTVEECLVAVWRKKLPIALGALLAAIVFCGMSFLMPERYRASVLMLPNEQDTQSLSAGLMGQLGGLASLAGVSPEVPASVKSESLAILRSRSFVGSFIEEEGITSMLFQDELFWIFSDKEPTQGDAFELFSDDVLEIEEDIETAVLSLSITWTDREEAAQWANRLYEKLNRHMRDRAIAQARSSLAFLERELAITSVDGVRVAIYGLMESQINNIMMANVNEEFAFRLVDQAHVPDVDKHVSPIRWLWLGLGGFLGLLVGMGVAIYKMWSGAGLVSSSDVTDQDD